MWVLMPNSYIGSYIRSYTGSYVRSYMRSYVVSYIGFFNRVHTVALCHSFWWSSASHLLISSVTDLFEIPIDGSGPVAFWFAANFASLSTIVLSLILLYPGIQRTVIWLFSASLVNASKHSQTSWPASRWPLTRLWSGRTLCYISRCGCSCSGKILRFTCALEYGRDLGL